MELPYLQVGKWQKLIWFSNCHAAAVARGEKPHHERNGPYPHAAQVVGRSENVFPTTHSSNSPEKHAALVNLWITTCLSSHFLEDSSWPRVTSMKSWNTDSPPPKTASEHKFLGHMK